LSFVEWRDDQTAVGEAYASLGEFKANARGLSAGFQPDLLLLLLRVFLWLPPELYAIEEASGDDLIGLAAKSSQLAKTNGVVGAIPVLLLSGGSQLLCDTAAPSDEEVDPAKADVEARSPLVCDSWCVRNPTIAEAPNWSRAGGIA
jgi:hypothetical protein